MCDNLNSICIFHSIKCLCVSVMILNRINRILTFILSINDFVDFWSVIDFIALINKSKTKPKSNSGQFNNSIWIMIEKWKMKLKLILFECAHLSFAYDHSKFQGKANVVAAMESMPKCEEKQCTDLAVVAIVQESKSLVHVFGNPMIGLHIETVNVMLESSGVLWMKTQLISYLWTVCHSIISKVKFTSKTINLMFEHPVQSATPFSSTPLNVSPVWIKQKKKTNYIRCWLVQVKTIFRSNHKKKVLFSLTKANGNGFGKQPARYVLV